MNETGPIDFEPFGKSAFCFYLQLFADSDIFHLKASKRQNGILVPVFLRMVMPFVAEILLLLVLCLNS